MGVLLGEAELREQLMTNNDEYRRLSAQHLAYSQQLEQLTSRHHLTPEERLREITLKKKKLLLKDQMYLMLQRFRKEIESGS